MRAVPKVFALVLCGIVLGACADEAAVEEMDEVPETEVAEPATPADAPLASFAGTWDAVSYLESGDTVPYTMTATSDTSGWTIDLPDRGVMPMRVVTAAGDSVVTEVGPYESILREGVTVTVRSVSRIQDGRMVGTMEARYAGAGADSVVRGRVEATRGM